MKIIHLPTGCMIYQAKTLYTLIYVFFGKRKTAPDNYFSFKQFGNCELKETDDSQGVYHPTPMHIFTFCVTVYI